MMALGKHCRWQYASPPSRRARHDGGEVEMADDTQKPERGLTLNRVTLIGMKLGKIGVKLFKALKVAKVALLGASAASYAAMFSWQFSALLIFAIFIHEAGHVRAMKMFGMRTKGI